MWNIPYYSGVKRLMREAIELANPTEEYYACPLEDNLFEWHFTVRGPPETEFEGGYYHGRILLPPQYPMQPPNIILLTVRVTHNLITQTSIYSLQFFYIYYYSNFDNLSYKEEDNSCRDG